MFSENVDIPFMEKTQGQEKSKANKDVKTSEIEFLNDVELTIAVEFGRVMLDIKTLLGLKKGTVIELNKLAGEPLDFYSNGNLVAQGEGVIVNENYGVRVTQIVNPQDFKLEDV
ncbi:MAG: flagellar motor switch protein FliN [Bdellovibrionota bacterium]